MSSWNLIPLGADLCDVVLESGDAVRCGLRVGHGGAHEHATERAGTRIVTWWYDVEIHRLASDLSRIGAR